VRGMCLATQALANTRRCTPCSAELSLPVMGMPDAPPGDVAPTSIILPLRIACPG